MPSRLALLTSIMLIAACACNRGFVEKEGEMGKDTRMTIPLEKALVLRNDERMGMVFQSILADVSEELRQGVEEGVQITSGQIMEDYRTTDEFLLLFPAKPVNGLMGQFILALSVQSVDPTTPGILRIRRAWMVQTGERFSVQVEMKANAAINEGWAYTRHPAVRQVYVAMFDDPDTVLEGQVFHQVPFRFQPSAVPQVRSAADWTTAEFVLDPYLVEQSRLIDYGEMLLEALDATFTARTGQYLQWSRPLVTLGRIETVASEEENRLLQEGERVSFNVTVEMDDQEITRKKRIRPLVQHSLTLVQEDGTRRAGTIGISVSTQ